MQRTVVYKEVIRIADKLMSEAIYEGNGLYWNSLYSPDGVTINWIKSESIYSGVSGITLFFIELYRVSNDKKYLQIAKLATNWLNTRIDVGGNNISFFTGQLGICYPNLKLYEITNDKLYLNICFKLVKFLINHKTIENNANELLNGNAGIVIFLLHLHKISQKDWLLKKIDLLVKCLIFSAHYSKFGLYWDKSHTQVRGLLGYSHGASGIAHAFLELGNYFKNESFYNIAELALSYESHLFDYQENNWLNYNRGFFDENLETESIQALLDSDMKYFTKGLSCIAWCHGAPGIGLVRLRAYELLKKKKYLSELKRAIKITVKSFQSFHDNDTYTLCHGLLGNAALLVEYYRIKPQQILLNKFCQVVMKSICSYKKNNFYLSGYTRIKSVEDSSLFMGIAGIGYKYLQALFPLKISSILYPCVASSPINNHVMDSFNLSYSESKVKEMLLEKHYGNTLKILKFYYKTELDDFLKINFSLNFKDKFEKFVAKLNLKYNENEASYTREIFKYEAIKQKLDENIESSILLHTSALYLKNYLSDELINTFDKIRECTLILRKDALIIKTNYNLRRKINNTNLIKNKRKKIYNIMLLPSAYDIEEHILSDLSNEIAVFFITPKTVKNFLDTKIMLFEIDSEQEKKQIEYVLLQQILNLIKLCALHPEAVKVTHC
jgi:hypothetical protein